MPCHVSDAENEYYDSEMAEERVDHLTKLLCEAISKLTDREDLSPDLKEWIEFHKDNDIENLKKEIAYLQCKLDKLETETEG